MLKYIIILYFLTEVITARAAVQDSLLKVSFEKLPALQHKEKRPVLVFIQTGWCIYCKVMEQTVFKNREVTKELNDFFYTIFLDAENRKEILFSGRVFSFKPTGEDIGIHQLAEELAAINGRISYPALCTLNSDNEIVFQYQGFLDKAGLLKLLNVLRDENR